MCGTTVFYRDYDQLQELHSRGVFRGPCVCSPFGDEKINVKKICYNLNTFENVRLKSTPAPFQISKCATATECLETATRVNGWGLPPGLRGWTPLVEY